MENKRSLSLATSFDINYYNYVKVMLKSFSINYHGNEKLDFYCLVPQDLLDKEKNFIQELQVDNLNIKFITSPNFINFLDNYENIPGANTESIWITKNAYHRIFLSSVLPEIDKIIYIDPDCFIRRNVLPLLQYPDYNKFMATAEIHSPDPISLTWDRCYFNNGVFITFLNYWRENDLENKMLDYLYKNGATTHPEQDLQNIFFADVFYPLPQSFNTFAFYDKLKYLDIFVKPDPLIVHFAGHTKPWSGTYNSEYAVEWNDLYYTFMV